MPDGVYEHFHEGIGTRGKQLRDGWFATIEHYKAKYPDLADQLYRIQHRQLPDGWDKDLPVFPADAKGMATRASSGKVLNAVAKNVPWLIGGAADLAPSTKTYMTFEGAGDFEADSYGGRNFHFGVREHAMGAIMNGMALIKVRAFGAGFLIFSDYGRMPIRLAALMEIPVIYVFTHDSIGVGEDGPTHQPIEQLASLRAIPGMTVIRPCDANEVVEAWRYIMKQHHDPAILVLTRQDLPTLDRTKYAAAAGLQKGAYVLADAPDGKPDVLLLATGSEVNLCVQAYEQLKSRGHEGPCRQHALVGDLRASARRVPRERDPAQQITARVAVEQASTFGWASLHRTHRRDHRHAHVRSIGSAQGAAQGVQLHRRCRHRGGEGAGAEGEVSEFVTGRRRPAASRAAVFFKIGHAPLLPVWRVKTRSRLGTNAMRNVHPVTWPPGSTRPRRPDSRGRCRPGRAPRSMSDSVRRRP